MRFHLSRVGDFALYYLDEYIEVLRFVIVEQIKEKHEQNQMMKKTLAKSL